MREQQFLGLIEKSVRAHWELEALTDYKGLTYSYKDFARHIEEFHIILKSAGINKGDKVAIVGRNSSRWAITFFGTLTYGAVAVPILHDFTPDIIHNIINHSEAKALMISAANYASLDTELIPNVELIMQLDDFTLLKACNEAHSAYDNLEKLFAEKFPSFSPEDVSYHIEDNEDLAVLNYTSGTTSLSKGVMIPFRSLWSNTKFAEDNLEFINPGDNILCMLPMAHMYGLAFEVLNSINKGCHIFFLTKLPSPAIIQQALKDIKPRLILAVPLIIEKMVKGNIFPIIEKPHMKLLLSLPVVNNIIRKKICEKINTFFGGEFEEIVIGGAAINKDVENFLREIKFRYTVGYGMTECGPLISYSQWDVFKPGSVGKIVDRMQAKIANPNPNTKVGEILVKGMNTMLGYYKNEEATKAVMLDNGWMRTGDLGMLDKNNVLYIKGRCKTMILGPNGQNIYPEEIEDKLNNKDFIVESLVISENEKLVALIYPDYEAIQKTSSNANPNIEKIMQENIYSLNNEIPRYCKVSSFRIMEKEFEKTPKRSIKRYLYQK
ncbi:MAG: AMP-binding protein [Parabacteroides sp.]|nr:AMP-binding protein [Parabacteroides sp.]